ncbi:3-isopropylmalate dehydratase [Mesobacillus maritimus]|uniref:LeuD/DmdB family oxidoreductase small subunit n=1 Tax=Mesobacillus maritimus TaxID=1643336 RepID=UPI002041D394|nr:3-isopropylmalate dehydratase [Mesobacillus maritimus]MCM3584960.1 3-isopropylmalate dehydratase [Mesobacillus maritimus]
MANIQSGRIWLLPDDVDTDVILAVRHLFLPTAEERARHALENLIPNFATDVIAGDVIVAGKNFGCGSSREYAPEALYDCGISCIVAKSFARIFYRNAINIGISLVENADIQDECEDGDLITVDHENRNIETGGRRYEMPKVPKHLEEIFKAGGLVNYHRKRNALSKEGGK